MAIAKTVYKKLNINVSERSYDFNRFLQKMDSVTDESVQNLESAKSFKNFSVSSGVLSTGLGLEQLKFKSKLTGTDTAIYPNYTGQPLAMYCFPYLDPMSSEEADCMVVYTSTKKVYYAHYVLPFRTFTELTTPEFENAPNYLFYIMPNRTQVMMFSTTLQPLTIFDFYSDYNQIQDAPQITSLCNHHDRIFGVTARGRSAVWFSDESDPTNWQVSSSSAGNIMMNDMLGDCKKVLSFKGYVYVFREYGITRISTYASQENFVVQNVYESSNYIYSNTAVICSDFILFLATDGLYSFNGVSVAKINTGFEKLLASLDQSYSKGVQYKNSYYLICQTSLSDVNTDELHSKNTLLKFDYLTGNYEFLIGSNYIDIEKFNSSKVEKLAVIELVNYQDSSNYTTRISQVEQSGEIYDTPTEKEWLSPKVDLGQANYAKNIFAISLQTLHDCTVKIITEKDEVSVHFSGSNVSQKKPVYISGVMVQIKITSNTSNVTISHPVLHYKIGKANA